MKPGEVKRVTKAEAATLPQQTAPAPGTAAREEWDRNKDALDAALAEDPREAIDPAKLEPEPEIQAKFQDGELPVSRADPGYDYCWTQADPRWGGNFVHAAQSHGWQVVRGDMPEAAEYAESDKAGQPTGNRRVGDVILMRIRKDVRAARRAQIDRRRLLRQADLETTAEMAAIAKKHRGIRVHTGTAALEKMRRHDVAKTLAMKQLDARLRTGTMPGMEMGS